MTMVYILSDYEEHGATNVFATTDAELLPDMISAFLVDDDAHAKELLRSLESVDLSVPSRDGIALARGWGGLKLHIVPLETGVAQMREERKEAIQAEEDAWKAAAEAFDAFRAKQTDKPGHMD